jgi:glycine oxidase
MGFTPDGLPLVGRLRPGLSICAGYTGHGMAFAFLGARALADHLAGGPAPPKWLDPARFRE